jgi:hypothetical protein
MNSVAYRRSLIDVTNTFYTRNVIMYLQKIHFSPFPHGCMKTGNLSTRSTRIPRYAYNGSNYPKHCPIDGIASMDGTTTHATLL